MNGSNVRELAARKAPKGDVSVAAVAPQAATPVSARSARATFARAAGALGLVAALGCGGSNAVPSADMPQQSDDGGVCDVCPRPEMGNVADMANAADGGVQYIMPPDPVTCQNNKVVPALSCGQTSDPIEVPMGQTIELALDFVHPTIIQEGFAYAILGQDKSGINFVTYAGIVTLNDSCLQVQGSDVVLNPTLQPTGSVQVGNDKLVITATSLTPLKVDGNGIDTKDVKVTLTFKRVCGPADAGQ